MWMFLIALAAVAPAAQNLPPDVPVEVKVIEQDARYQMRTNDGGMPLYTFDRDAPGKSSCAGDCARLWLPVTAPAGAKPVGKWTAIARSDGKRQWAWDGKPVYTFAHDSEGVPTADGMNGVWHLLPAPPVR